MYDNQETYELSSASKRFAAAMINYILLIFSGAAIFIFVESSGNGNKFAENYGILISVSILLVYIVFQTILLTLRGQSIGKFIMKIKIVRHITQEKVGFARLILVRTVLNRLLYIFQPYGIVDLAFIFNRDTRCVHDHIADTDVIDLSKVKVQEDSVNIFEDTIKSPKTTGKALNIIIALIIILILGSFASAVYIDSKTVKKSENGIINTEKTSFTSYDEIYSIFASDSWKYGNRSSNTDASLILRTKDEEKGFIGIREYKNDFGEGFSLKDYADIVLKGKQQDGAKIKKEEIKNITINGNNAIQCEFELVVDIYNIKYLYTFVETDKNFYQLINYCAVSQFENSRQEFYEMRNSFNEATKL